MPSVLAVVVCFFKFRLFTERVTGGDERGTVGVTFRHKLCEFRAGQANLCFEYFSARTKYSVYLEAWISSGVMFLYIPKW